jgi:hypothetical protein
VWADSDSEGESERPSLGGRKKDYTAPVNFVRGGIQGVKDGTGDIEEKEVGVSDASSGDEESETRAGFGSSSGGLGFR